MFGDPVLGYYLISGVMFVIGAIISARFKSKFKEYSAMPLQQRLSGREVAEKMLRENGIHDVQVISTNSYLSNYYNPEDKTVNLDPGVYSGESVAAAAVAAHECGHAVQHATGYAPLKLRSAMVPVTQISTTLAQWVILAGLGLLFVRSNPYILIAGIVLFAVSTVFSLITLPVEYDASNRALSWLNSAGITYGDEHAAAKDALKWAARTYLVAAVASVVTLLYYVSLLNGRRSE